jgi:hypothetical protein
VATPGQFLEHLKLDKCAIPESGGLLLVAALLNANKKLTVLSLSNNFLGNKSACLFGDLLEANHTLLELDLSWNQVKVGPAGEQGDVPVRPWFTGLIQSCMPGRCWVPRLCV